MDYVTHLADSRDFFMGALVMGVLMLVLMVYAAHMRAQTLYYCWLNKTAEKIGKDFYYLVREDTYNRLAPAFLKLREDDRVFGESFFPMEVVSPDAIPYVMYIQRSSWLEYYCGNDCKSSNIRAAKFYWSKAEAEVDQEAFRLIYPLDQRKTVLFSTLDQFATDSVAMALLIFSARKQLADRVNQLEEIEHGTHADQGL